MTQSAYIKTLIKKLNRRQDAIKKLSQKRYKPYSFKDYNAFYIQEEIKFIKNFIESYQKQKLENQQ